MTCALLLYIFGYILLTTGSQSPISVMRWLFQWNNSTNMLKSLNFLSFTLCSVCVECVCGEKSSSCGIRQLLLQQLRQWWRREQDRVYIHWERHNRDHHHRCWQGDHPAHCRRQKWESSLHQVQYTCSHTNGWCGESPPALYCTVLCCTVLSTFLSNAYVEASLLYPSILFPVQFLLSPSLHCFSSDITPLLSVPTCLISPWLQSIQTSRQTVCCAWGP